MIPELVHADCVDVARYLADTGQHADAIVTDPPYGLGFMGEQWDRELPGRARWSALLEASKPGAHLVACGHPKTWHRLACEIEDAGWEIRGSLAWLFGQGYPKSPAVLKPGHEPIVLARRPLVGTLEENLARYGTGALEIERCRIEVPAGDAKGGASYANESGRVVGRERGEPGVGFAQRAGDPRDGKGRWPADVLLDEEAAALLDAQSGTLKSGDVKKTYDPIMQTSVALGPKRRSLHPGAVIADAGGASRFFYTAKASRSERTHDGQVANTHRTVKPIALMRWLVRLVTPAGGLVLDPFCGSGTTLVACMLEGVHAIGCDRNEVLTARARVACVQRELSRQ